MTTLRPAWTARTADEVGQFLGVSRRTVQQYVAQGMPVEKGRYDLAAIVAWCRTNVWESSQKSEVASQKELADLRAAQATAMMKQIRAKQMAGGLVDRQAVSTQLRTAFATIKAKLLSLPEALSLMVPADCRADVFASAENQVHRMLTELAELANRPPAGPVAAETQPAQAAKAKPRSKRPKRK